MPKSLHPIGKALCRGGADQLTKAVFKSEELQESIFLETRKRIEKECSVMCQKKEPSVLRLTGPGEMKGFQLEDVQNDLRRGHHYF